MGFIQGFQGVQVIELFGKLMLVALHDDSFTELRYLMLAVNSTCSLLHWKGDLHSKQNCRIKINSHQTVVAFNRYWVSKGADPCMNKCLSDARTACYHIDHLAASLLSGQLSVAWVFMIVKAHQVCFLE